VASCWSDLIWAPRPTMAPCSMFRASESPSNGVDRRRPGCWFGPWLSPLQSRSYQIRLVLWRCSRWVILVLLCV
jgi:hypothetical protein